MTENYKHKYDELMERCTKFMSAYPYELGFKAGWEAAKQEFHKDNTYVPDTTKSAKTLDIQWPRDYPNTTNPWPPTTVVYQACGVCGIGDINKAMGYVCYNPKCPTRVTCTSTTGTTS